MFAFTGLKMKYATNKLQMYILAGGGREFFYILKTLLSNGNPIVENNLRRMKGHTPHTHYLPFSLSPAK